MNVVRAVALGVVGALAFAGCGGTPDPSRSAAVQAPSVATATVEAIMPLPTDELTAGLIGPWQRQPIEVDSSHTAIVSDGCAVAARDQLGDSEADLPTALMDARGARHATVILADDLSAIECLAELDETALAATVVSVARLSKTLTAAVDERAVSVASVGSEGDTATLRTLALGRAGSSAAAVRVELGDGSVVVGTVSDGWWSAWWPGATLAKAYSAVDAEDRVIGTADPFAGQREARVGAASWWLDPASKPVAGATTIRGFVLERDCAGGRTPEGRIEPPDVELSESAITIEFEIRRLPGAQDCPGNPPFPVSITLPEPLGARILLDGSSTPPRDATVKPTG